MTVRNLLLVFGRAQQFACNQQHSQHCDQNIATKKTHATKVTTQPPRLLREPDVFEDPDSEDTVVRVVMLLLLDLKLKPLLALW